MLAILLVGGLGTRLRPLTHHRPKALMPILNIPFLVYQLETLKKAGVTDVALAAGNRAKQWEGAIRSLKFPGIKIHFVYEKELLGTGGAIRFVYDQMKKKIKNVSDPVIVFNGDVLFDLDLKTFIRFHQRNKADVSLSLTRVLDPSRFGLVIMNKAGRIQRFLEKPKIKMRVNYINAGCYLFNAAMIESIPAGEVTSIERDSFPSYLKSHRQLLGYKAPGYWNDIGTPATYLQAHKDLLGKNKRFTSINFLHKRAVPLSGLRSMKKHGVRLMGAVSVGARVTIEPGVVITDSVIHEDVFIGRNTVVSGAIIAAHSVIGHDSIIKEGAVLGEKTFLPPYTKC